MNAQAAPRGARIMARLVVALAAVLIALVAAWYGFSA
jgi:hypothetical protein